MKTKTLLIAAATLAAGIISTQAQSNVYSANIVGYVNTTLYGGNAFNLVTAPLGGTNVVEGIINNPNVGDIVYIWDPSGTNIGYTLYYYYGSNFDGNGNSWGDANYNGVPSPIVGPGQAFFYQNSGSTVTNTFVGTVILTNSAVVYGGNAFNFIASAPPVTDVGEGTNLALPLNVGDVIYTWTPSGTNIGYTLYYYYGSNFDGNGNSWGDANYNGVASPVLGVGQGFLYQNSGSTATWSQNLIVN